MIQGKTLIAGTIVILALIASATILAITNHDNSFIRYATLFGGLAVNAAGIFGLQLRVTHVARKIDRRAEEIKATVKNGVNGHDQN